MFHHNLESAIILFAGLERGKGGDKGGVSFSVIPEVHKNIPFLSTFPTSDICVCVYVYSA